MLVTMSPHSYTIEGFEMSMHVKMHTTEYYNLWIYREGSRECEPPLPLLDLAYINKVCCE